MVVTFNPSSSTWFSTWISLVLNQPSCAICQLCCNHMKIQVSKDDFRSYFFRLKAVNCRWQVFFFLEITERWGNFVVSHIMKRTVMLYSTYSTWICTKNSQLPCHPFNKEGRILLCIQVWDRYGCEEMCEVECIQQAQPETL